MQECVWMTGTVELAEMDYAVDCHVCDSNRTVNHTARTSRTLFQRLTYVHQPTTNKYGEMQSEMLKSGLNTLSHT